MTKEERMKEMKQTTRWGGMWRSENRLDGKTRGLLFDDCLPVLRCTRREMREYIEKRYGYIRKRPDLRSEPHGWKMPIPVRVWIKATP